MGADVTSEYRTARRMLGVVPQELVFDPFFTVRETLRLQSGYFGIRGNDAWIDEVMHHLDLTGKADANMRSLSGGMKRRVLVAQALVHKPPVIVLDEPTAGVDVELRQALWRFIQRLNREGHTVLLTTHYLEEAEALCNRVAMLKRGKMVALDTMRNLLNSVAACRVQLRLSGSLPAALTPQLVEQTDDTIVLALASYPALEGVLAQLREAGVAVLEMNLQQADLEDVFLQVVGQGQGEP
jgi:ABC-2 type transport system ATP-binding protein